VPELGRPAVREVFEGPYRLVYHVKDTQVDVIAVIHGARSLDEGSVGED